MKPFTIIFLLFIAFPLMSQNSSNTESNENTHNIDNVKEEIIKYYSSPDCFQLIFRTDVVIPQFGKQSVNGTVRADNIKNRIRIILTEPNLGIIYSWMTVIDNNVYMSNPRETGVIKKNLSEVELGSLANNQIKLPFALFQDILFGRIPEKIKTNGTWEFTDKRVSVAHNDSVNSIEILFSEKDHKRIEKIIFFKNEYNYKAVVNFFGKFYDTKYPERINIQTSQNNKPLESMDIVFYRYIDKAWCRDEFFPIR